MKTPFYKFIVFSLVVAILTTISPVYLLAQNKLVGEIVVTKLSADGFVTVNGERVESGRSIMATSKIKTSPQANAKVVFSQTGTVLIEPNSNLNLSFVNSGISGKLINGKITVQTAPNTTLNFSTPDGVITLPITNQSNILKVTVENQKTQLYTLSGQSRINKVLVLEGAYYPEMTGGSTTASNNPVNNSNSTDINPLLILGVLGAVGAVILIAVSASGNDNTGTPIVSPTR
ncbi:MAG TPA: hypothetical protein VF556_09775 [Pyrinomonadaceae bacterium]